MSIPDMHLFNGCTKNLQEKIRSEKAVEQYTGSKIETWSQETGS